ncbi:hypothetical protein HT031_000703 [Scenedesmus sp. PABB004]|nr:hypothetical protein HT031_000703 [Scenedesmus sp. PABB004]
MSGGTHTRERAIARGCYDMSRASSNRPLTSKYVAYLSEWDRRDRRLKKAAEPLPEAAHREGRSGGARLPRPSCTRGGGGAPGAAHRCAAAAAAGAASELNGVKVARKGRGAPPPSNREVLWSTHGRREVAGKSHAAVDGLLTTMPASDAGALLTGDLTRSRFVRRVTHHFNESSLAGGGALVKDEVSTERRPIRKAGEANPGWGIAEHMAKTLAFTGEAWEERRRSARRQVWTVAAEHAPNTADSIIRHRHDDPELDAEPAATGERVLTPALRKVNVAESRAVFLANLQSYAANLSRAHHGDARLRATSSSFKSAGLGGLAGL